MAQGRLQMATRALDLHQASQHAWFPHRAESTSTRPAQDIRAAAWSLEDMVRTEGLRIMAWHDLSTLARMVDEKNQPLDTTVFGWSEQELAAWHGCAKAMHSPLLSGARVAGEPFWANGRAIHARIGSRALGRINLDDFDELTSVRAAIVIPVQLPFGQIGAAILSSSDPAKFHLAKEFARARETLVPSITRFLSDYAAINRDDRFLPDYCPLSSREIECLTWVAHGKTDHEISIILGRSHAGVRYHITRTCAKLDAVNRTHAVFRAVQLGYISLTPP